MHKNHQSGFINLNKINAFRENYSLEKLVCHGSLFVGSSVSWNTKKRLKNTDLKCIFKKYSSLKHAIKINIE